VQRFGSALNLNPHFHVLMPDGVYVTGQDGTPSFVRVPQLSDDDVQQIVETTAKRVVRLLQRDNVKCCGWRSFVHDVTVAAEESVSR